nr:MAG: ORF1 [Torque teno midi virus]
MPFYWRRRRRYWWPRKRYNTYTKRRYKRTRRRWPRRTRKAFRRKRRRRRRRKVRRKKPTITIKQWQPDSITKCKIKGIGTLILGAAGRQMVCYTNVKQQLTPPKTPCGGGFACEQYSLGYLYEEYKFRRNVWTKTNIGKDLCRYLLCKFTFYRHEYIDFIINYDRQPPFDADQFVYTWCHPLALLLGRHKKILLSERTNPKGKLKKTLIIKPPKQMLTKWFFTSDFAKFPLLLIRAAACNFRYPNIGCCSSNQILTFFYINNAFYKNGNWAYHPSAVTTPYYPYERPKTDMYFWGKKPPPDETGALTQDKMKLYNVTQYTIPDTYDKSISWASGWFSKAIVGAVAVSTNKDFASFTGIVPTNTCRYNPSTDDGKGNYIWLKSTLNPNWDKPRDQKLIVAGLPLWLGLYGWLSWLQMHNKDRAYFETYLVCIQSPSFYISSQPVTNDIVAPIDTAFTQGKWPFDEPITHAEHLHWWPNVYHQLDILNSIVTCGPYIPKFDPTTVKNSTWELHYYYQFLFKWGGPEQTEPAITDPKDLPTYLVPDKYYSTIQIRDPQKQKYESLLHPWDYRRGLIKGSALKRVSSNISTDTTFQPDAVPIKKKKVTGPELSVPQQETEEIQNCLLSLCEENIYQEENQDNLLQLIKQQQQQQQELKYNLLRLLSELKEKQRQLQLQTGMLN